MENWSIGDTLGLDNDGNGDYDGADIECLPEPASELLFAAAGLTLLALRVSRGRQRA
jgi:hypothetical protein